MKTPTKIGRHQTPTAEFRFKHVEPDPDPESPEEQAAPELEFVQKNTHVLVQKIPVLAISSPNPGWHLWCQNEGSTIC